jgi:hypothetical protein
LLAWGSGTQQQQVLFASSSQAVLQVAPLFVALDVVRSRSRQLLIGFVLNEFSKAETSWGLVHGQGRYKSTASAVHM